MKDVTPKSNLEILIKCLGIAIAIVLVITLLRLAFRIFLSVVIWIIPITLVLFIYHKFNDKWLLINANKRIVCWIC